MVGIGLGGHAELFKHPAPLSIKPDRGVPSGGPNEPLRREAVPTKKRPGTFVPGRNFTKQRERPRRSRV
jgi:hypothetical protein